MAELTALERRLARQKKFETRAREWKGGTRESVHAMEVGLSVVVGALLGFVVDKNFDLLPWGTLIGTAFGVAAGARTLYRISKKIIADGEDDLTSDDGSGREEWGETSEPLTEEQRAAQAREAGEALARLTRYGFVVCAAAVCVGFVLWQTGVPGAEGFTKGVAIGGLIGVLNLRILARALWGVMSGQKVVPLLGILASFVLLIAVAWWLAMNAESWVFGYGIGLALPAPTGIWFALSVARRDEGE